MGDMPAHEDTFAKKAPLDTSEDAWLFHDSGRFFSKCKRCKNEREVAVNDRGMPKDYRWKRCYRVACSRSPAQSSK